MIQMHGMSTIFSNGLQNRSTGVEVTGIGLHAVLIKLGLSRLKIRMREEVSLKQGTGKKVQMGICKISFGQWKV